MIADDLANVTLGPPGDPCVRQEQIDFFMGPRDLQSATWCLNRTRLRTWDHFPVVVKIDGKELRGKKEKQSWARWFPKSEDEKTEVPRIN